MSSHSKITIFILLTTAFFLLMLISFRMVFILPATIHQKATVCIKSNCFLAKVADTTQKRELGLMSVDALKKNEGMLFVFPEKGNYSFWMKNTLLPLDIIWINNNITRANLIHFWQDLHHHK
jgi:uncharacterized membrane protein (UPF0127 family)